MSEQGRLIGCSMAGCSRAVCVWGSTGRAQSPPLQEAIVTRSWGDPVMASPQQKARSSVSPVASPDTGSDIAAPVELPREHAWSQAAGCAWALCQGQTAAVSTPVGGAPRWNCSAWWQSFGWQSFYNLLDFSKVFNTVSHSVLPDKMYGI